MLCSLFYKNVFLVFVALPLRQSVEVSWNCASIESLFGLQHYSTIMLTIPPEEVNTQ